jgi:hypothetical protein
VKEGFPKITNVRWNANRFGTTHLIELVEWRHILRKQPEMFRHRSKFLSPGNFFHRNGSLRDRCYASLEHKLPELDESVTKYIQSFNIPNATIFLRMLRVPNILALRELARQSFAGPMSDNYQKMLAIMPVGTQSELNFMFERLRNELDIVIDKNWITNLSSETSGLGRITEQLITIFNSPSITSAAILDTYHEIEITDSRHSPYAVFVETCVSE